MARSYKSHYPGTLRSELGYQLSHADRLTPAVWYFLRADLWKQRNLNFSWAQLTTDLQGRPVRCSVLLSYRTPYGMLHRRYIQRK